MTARKIGIGIVLLAFGDLTAYALYQHGVAGVVQLEMANSVTITAFVDLVIALSLIIAWMWQDARERGVSAMPYVLLTLGFGSVGPLLYLLLRRDGARDRLAVRAGAPVRAAL
ncbi:MAG: DUF2834 domain-containing protein [Deltaproteobacteria bacterium]|nr:MAG: DUF2834 domain-containing protein [Deltaproteobacteria bacterium]